MRWGLIFALFVCALSTARGESLCDGVTNGQAVGLFHIPDYGPLAFSNNINSAIYSNRVGGALYFSAATTNTFLQFDNAVAMVVGNTTNDISVSFWIKRLGYADVAACSFSLGNLNADNDQIILQPLGNTMVFQLRDHAGTVLRMTNSLASNVWTQVGFVWDATAEAATYYLNGVITEVKTNTSLSTCNLSYGSLGNLRRQGVNVYQYPQVIDDFIMARGKLDVGKIYTNTVIATYVDGWHLPYSTNALVYRMECWTPGVSSIRPIAAYRTAYELITGAYR